MQNAGVDLSNLKTEKKPIGVIRPMEISLGEFNLIRKLIYERFGINLSDKKRGFVVSRLQKLLRAEGVTSFKRYYENILQDKSGNSLKQLASYISTNYTFFNREHAHFDFFYKTALPAIVQEMSARNLKDLRVWCAGCSSGEEPYMLAMLMLEFFGADYPSWNAGVLATDISEKALKVAMTGVYSDDQVDPVPKMLKAKYFKRVGKEHWSISQVVKKEVTYRRFNLMNSDFPFKRAFHIVFCRNVMIYFDKPTRDSLIRRFYQFTEPGGYFFIGHSESLTRGECPYEYIMPALYRRTQ